ncbi:hypothetical protein [Corynebacterium phoceense]|nr:hypothetical protein [Corynebacterium phoceense]
MAVIMLLLVSVVVAVVTPVPELDIEPDLILPPLLYATALRPAPS